MLLDFTRHYQALSESANKPQSIKIGDATFIHNIENPPYKEALNSLKPIVFEKFANKKGVLAYTTPREKLHNLSDDDLARAVKQFNNVISQFEAALAGKKGANRSIIKSYNRLDSTIQKLKTPLTAAQIHSNDPASRLSSKLKF